jgi:hypothetical protein
MDETKQKHRLGLITVSDVIWMRHRDEILNQLRAEGAHIEEPILQALGDDSRYRAAKAIVMIHPEFDEVSVDGGPIAHYECRFSFHDNLLVRTPMRRVR